SRSTRAGYAARAMCRRSRLADSLDDFHRLLLALRRQPQLAPIRVGLPIQVALVPKVGENHGEGTPGLQVLRLVQALERLVVDPMLTQAALHGEQERDDRVSGFEGARPHELWNVILDGHDVRSGQRPALETEMSLHPRDGVIR